MKNSSLLGPFVGYEEKEVLWIMSLDLILNITETKHSRLFRPNVSDKEKSCYNVCTWGQYYKTFYGRNVQILLISLSICPW